MQNTFAKFTNQYSLSKTLRFELKPVGKTQQMLENNKVFEIDENKKTAYKNIKPYFDRIHREFVEEALSDVNLSNLENYLKAFS
jgi:CRISPR-associated protein Cpf1